MYSLIMKTLNGIDSRYPTREEEQLVLGWAESLPRRLQAAQTVQQTETAIIAASIEEMKRRWPRFQPLHDRGWEKSQRDMQLCLRYSVQAMLVEDADMPRDKLFIWLGTVVKAMGMTTQFVRDSYTILKDQCRKQLPADAYRMMETYLDRLIQDMTCFLEPSRPAVG
ncbi:MAG: hypothetical protein K2R98_25605 [Gemmataceae bacterium]|nr:hypothetical protein [Gemmataceae bacterium]